MDTINIYGILGAVFIGIILGLTGGGGSILTVPVLVYILNINPITATAYSLFIVGTTSLVGIIRNAQKQLINYKTALVFAIPSLISVFLTRKYFVPKLPEIIFQTTYFSCSKEMFIMIFFSVLMFLASITMIRETNYNKFENKKFNNSILAIEGIFIGFATGLVGAGGGFLIVPALVIFANLSIREAISTSLLIISIKSLFGFLGDIKNLTIDWEFLISFTSISIIGIILGIWISNFINGKNLKKFFGYFVLIMSIFIIFSESIF